MTIHVGQVTSEVVIGVPVPSPPAGAGADRSVWAERARLEALLARIDRDRMRTATGHGDD